MKCTYLHSAVIIFMSGPMGPPLESMTEAELDLGKWSNREMKI